MNEQARAFLTALRHLDTLPDRVDKKLDFGWDFGRRYFTMNRSFPLGAFEPNLDCGTLGCAMGLALAAGYTELLGERGILKIFGIDDTSLDFNLDELPHILNLPVYYGYPGEWDKITPSMVADALEAWYFRHLTQVKEKQE